MNNYDDMNQKSNMIIYTTEDGLTKIETTFDEDTVWLSIDQMAELFQRDKSTISRHIKMYFPKASCSESQLLQICNNCGRWKTYQVDYYNLDVIISVGYRVKSKRGTQFRIWATNILKEYMKKGFALDDERLKIWAAVDISRNCLKESETSVHRKRCFIVRCLKSMPPALTTTRKRKSLSVFQKVQNKIHYAIHGQTAAEVIYTRADAEKSSWDLPPLPVISRHSKKRLLRKLSE